MRITEAKAHPLWSVTCYTVELAPLSPLLFQGLNIYVATSEGKALCQVVSKMQWPHAGPWSLFRACQQKLQCHLVNVALE